MIIDTCSRAGKLLRLRECATESTDEIKNININLGLIKEAKDKDELLKFINLSKDKKNKLWKSQQENFRSNYPNLGNSSLKVIKVIKEAQKILNNQKEVR